MLNSWSNSNLSYYRLFLQVLKILGLYIGLFSDRAKRAEAHF